MYSVACADVDPHSLLEKARDCQITIHRKGGRLILWGLNLLFAMMPLLDGDICHLDRVDGAHIGAKSTANALLGVDNPLPVLLASNSLG